MNLPKPTLKIPELRFQLLEVQQEVTLEPTWFMTAQIYDRLHLCVSHICVSHLVITRIGQLMNDFTLTIILGNMTQTVAIFTNSCMLELALATSGQTCKIQNRFILPKWNGVHAKFLCILVSSLILRLSPFPVCDGLYCEQSSLIPMLSSSLQTPSSLFLHAISWLVV